MIWRQVRPSCLAKPRISANRLSPGGATSADSGSGDIRYRVIGQGQGLALWLRWVGTDGCEGVGLRIPGVEMFEDSFDHIDIADERDGAHVAAAVDTLDRIDLVHLLNQPGPGGLATAVGSLQVDNDRFRCVTFLLG